MFYFRKSKGLIIKNMLVKSNAKSFEGSNASVYTTGREGPFGKLFTFMEPAYLIGVGCIDPGDQTTDKVLGSWFGYIPIWVLLMSNIIAVLIQWRSVRLGVVSVSFHNLIIQVADAKSFRVSPV